MARLRTPLGRPSPSRPGELLDPGNDPGHPSSCALRLVRKLPAVVVAVPERVALNAAFVLIGASAFLADTGDSVVTSWPEWVKFAFALTLTAGGLAVLAGMTRQLTSVERLGYVLVIPPCLLYAFSAIFVRGLPGIPVLLMFTLIAAAKAIRLVISSAERDLTIEYGQRLDREKSADRSAVDP